MVYLPTFVEVDSEVTGAVRLERTDEHAFNGIEIVATALGVFVEAWYDSGHEIQGATLTWAELDAIRARVADTEIK